MGITTGNVEFDLGQIMTYKEKVVKGLTGGIELLFKKNKVEYLKGAGSFKSNDTLNVKLNDGGEKTIKVKNVIIATGSEANNLPGGVLPIDENLVVSSTGN
jgi:dihydrolipoamide dehydrogenase